MREQEGREGRERKVRDRPRLSQMGGRHVTEHHLRQRYVIRKSDTDRKSDTEVFPAVPSSCSIRCKAETGVDVVRAGGLVPSRRGRSGAAKHEALKDLQDAGAGHIVD